MHNSFRAEFADYRLENSRYKGKDRNTTIKKIIKKVKPDFAHSRAWRAVRAAARARMLAPEWTPLAIPGAYLSLRCVTGYPDSGAARDLLTLLAAVTAPLCAAHGWTVGVLAESDHIAPHAGGAVVAGLNVNRGAKIELQLRSVANSRAFCTVPSLLDTLTHELAHNVHSDHGSGFHALWNALNTECEANLTAGRCACPSAYGGGPAAVAELRKLVELWRPKRVADMGDVRKRLHHVAKGGIAVNDGSIFEETAVERRALPDGGTMAWFTAVGWTKKERGGRRGGLQSSRRGGGRGGRRGGAHNGGRGGLSGSGRTGADSGGAATSATEPQKPVFRGTGRGHKLATLKAPTVSAAASSAAAGNAVAVAVLKRTAAARMRPSGGQTLLSAGFGLASTAATLALAAAKRDRETTSYSQSHPPPVPARAEAFVEDKSTGSKEDEEVLPVSFGTRQHVHRIAAVRAADEGEDDAGEDDFVDVQAAEDEDEDDWSVVDAEAVEDDEAVGLARAAVAAAAATSQEDALFIDISTASDEDAVFMQQAMAMQREALERRSATAGPLPNASASAAATAAAVSALPAVARAPTVSATEVGAFQAADEAACAAAATDDVIVLDDSASAIVLLSQPDTVIESSPPAEAVTVTGSKRGRFDDFHEKTAAKRSATGDVMT